MSVGVVRTSWKSAFLDTNALVSLFAYWQVCQENGISLSSVVDLRDLKSRLGNKIPIAGTIPSDDYQPIRLGLACFQNLAAAKDRYLFFTSALCCSELHHVILSSIASEKLTKLRVPYCLRVKRPQMLYRRALELTDYNKLSAALDDFFLSLRVDYGLAIPEVEDPAAAVMRTSQEILEAARQIWSRVLIEVMDACIFAAAVLIDSEVFLCGDEPLRDAVNKLREPTTTWRSAARSLNLALQKQQNDPFPLAMRLNTPLP